MTDTQAQEAVSAIREALETYAPQRPFGQQCPVRMALERVDEVSALLRSQAARIAELESRVHTCGPTCSKAGCINRRITAERDALRAELARMREPLSDEQVQAIINTKHFDPKHVLRNSDLVCLSWYRLGLRDGEAAHGITKTGGGV